MAYSEPSPPLSPEEAFLWSCARNWPNPPETVDPASLDWQTIVPLAVRNRMQVLLDRQIEASNMRVALPRDAADALHVAVDKYVTSAGDMTALLRRYLPRASERRIDSAVFKGMHLCEKIYHDPEIRPGTDIDLLVRRHQVQQSVTLLEELGLGRFWSPLLADRYYDRHHLHQQRCTPGREIWVDIHWALDHPYNCLTTDYDALMDRSRASTLVGCPVRELSATDDLLCLAVHLVKHAVYLPAVLERGDLRRIILADGYLMYFVDIVALLNRYGARVDWSIAATRAREWGAEVSLYSSLRVCRDLLAGPIPDDALADMSPDEPGSVTRWVMTRLADHKVSEHLGRKSSPFAAFLFGYNESLVLRPVRLLDLSSYFLPTSDFLRRRHGSATLLQAAKHAVRALGSAVRFCLDTVYYTTKRQIWPNPVPPAEGGSLGKDASTV